MGIPNSCSICSHSEYIDGTLFCYYIFDDVALDYVCKYFKHYKKELENGNTKRLTKYDGYNRG